MSALGVGFWVPASLTAATAAAPIDDSTIALAVDRLSTLAIRSGALTMDPFNDTNILESCPLDPEGDLAASLSAVEEVSQSSLISANTDVDVNDAGDGHAIFWVSCGNRSETVEASVGITDRPEALAEFYSEIDADPTIFTNRAAFNVPSIADDDAFGYVWSRGSDSDGWDTLVIWGADGLVVGVERSGGNRELSVEAVAAAAPAVVADLILRATDLPNTLSTGSNG